MFVSVSNETLVVSFHVNYQESFVNRELSVFLMLRHKPISCALEEAYGNQQHLGSQPHGNYTTTKLHQREQ